MLESMTASPDASASRAMRLRADAGDDAEPDPCASRAISRSIAIAMASLLMMLFSGDVNASSNAWPIATGPTGGLRYDTGGGGGGAGSFGGALGGAH